MAQSALIKHGYWGEVLACAFYSIYVKQPIVLAASQYLALKGQGTSLLIIAENRW
ncbi:hypothetical protein ACRBF7_000220 [Providencia stuartii]